MIRCPNCLIKFKLAEDSEDLVFCPTCLFVFKQSSLKLQQAFHNLAKALSSSRIYLAVEDLNENLAKMAKVFKKKFPSCFKSNPSFQAQAENDCCRCKFENECLTINFKGKDHGNPKN